MDHRQDRPAGVSRGISLAEVLVVLATIAILAALALPTATRAIQAARRASLATTGQTLLRAIERYAVDHGHPPWPGSNATGGFNLRTLSPLVDAGYVRNPAGMLEKLRDRRVTAYDTPGLPGKEGFWALLIDAERPEIQVLVASTDRFPLADGVWIDGVYAVRGHRLERVDDGSPVPSHAALDVELDRIDEQGLGLLAQASGRERPRG